MTSATRRVRSWVERSLAAAGHDATLDQIVLARRLLGDSWQDVSFIVRFLSGESLTPQTLITWFPEYNKDRDDLLAEFGEPVEDHIAVTLLALRNHVPAS